MNNNQPNHRLTAGKINNIATMCPPPFVTIPVLPWLHGNDLRPSSEAEEPQESDEQEGPLSPRLSTRQHSCEACTSSSSFQRLLGHRHLPLDEEVGREENLVRLRRRPKRGFFNGWVHEFLPNMIFVLAILQR